MVDLIFTRVRRVIRASIEDAADSLERAGGEGVMREAIREVDRAVDDVKTEYNKVVEVRMLAARRERLLSERLEELEQKATFAIDQGRDDLAEAALSRQIDFEAQFEQLEATQVESREQENKLEECIKALEVRKQQMEDDLKAFTLAKQDAEIVSAPSGSKSKDTEKAVKNAEAAFDRALEAAGHKANVRPGDAEDATKIAEIDVMFRHSKISDRLEALKEKRMAS